MSTILIKRGNKSDISNLNLEYGEVALVYDSDNSRIDLYAGNGNEGKILLNPDVQSDIGNIVNNITTLSNRLDGLASVAETGDYIDLSNRPIIPVYATCSTASSTTEKVATTTSDFTNNFTLKTGATVYVKFTNTNSVSSPTLNVNNTGAKSIKQYNTTAPLTYSWYAGSIVEFTYDGSYWIMSSKEAATTTYAGVVKLSNSTTSDVSTTAATSSAVYSVKNSLTAETTNRIDADNSLQSQIDDLYDTKLDGNSDIDGGTF